MRKLLDAFSEAKKTAGRGQVGLLAAQFGKFGKGRITLGRMGDRATLA